jgi:beta-aspartyl-peptidase (threonine type)
MPLHAIAVHGGAGTLSRADLTPENDRAYRAGLERALRAGHALLAGGGTSLDAVVAAVAVLEDDPLFNAGRGAVLAANGQHELDASVMDGRERRAGAVTGVRHVRSPIELARLVMERSPHVMLAGAGAEEFALEQGLTPVPNAHFATERRRRELERLLKGEAEPGREALMGTVGAVALDRHGNLAAATSTGGMTGKKWGRVGDSPIIGAGTYAANDCCAVSATGHGEYFIRAAVAHEIAALMRYRDLDVVTAAEDVVLRQLVELGGSGGVIAVGRDGRIAMPFNSDGMLRGAMDSSGRLETGLLRE